MPNFLIGRVFRKYIFKDTSPVSEKYLKIVPQDCTSKLNEMSE